MIEISIDPLRAHISYCAHRRIARVHGLFQNPTDPKIGDLDLVPAVDQEIRGLDIAMHDLTSMEVGEAAQDLLGQIGEGPLVLDALALQRPAVH